MRESSHRTEEPAVRGEGGRPHYLAAEWAECSTGTRATLRARRHSVWQRVGGLCAPQTRPKDRRADHGPTATRRD